MSSLSDILPSTTPTTPTTAIASKPKIKQWTLALVTDYFKTRNFTVLETEDLKSRALWRYRCACGNDQCKISVNNFRAGADNCKACAQKKKEATNMERFGVTCPWLSASVRLRVTEARAKRKLVKQAIETKHKINKPTARSAVLSEQIMLSKEYLVELERAKELIAAGKIAKPRFAHSNTPRWPAPRPKRKENMHVPVKQWNRMKSNWKNSTPHAIAMTALWSKTEYAQARSKGTIPARKRPVPLNQNAEQVTMVATTRHELKIDLSVDGHCAFQNLETSENTCNVPARLCDIHHQKPTENFEKDGLPRKHLCISACNSIEQIQNEIERNTNEDGTLLLKLLCPEHHAAVTYTNLYAGCGTTRRRWKAVAEMKIQINACQYEDCVLPDVHCNVLAHSPLFHFDHLFTKNDRNIPESHKKIASVSQMIQNLKRFTMDDITAEIAKCRLVHATCHRLITRAQIDSGRMQPSTFTTEFDKDEAEIAARVEEEIANDPDTTEDDNSDDSDDEDSEDDNEEDTDDMHVTTTEADDHEADSDADEPEAKRQKLT